MLNRRGRDEDIPIKIGGWNGKFVTERGPGKVMQHRNDSSINVPVEVTRSSQSPDSGDRPRKYATGNNYFGYNTETEVLPVAWDGTFVGQGYRHKPDRNQSSTNQFYGYSNEPTILPAQWSGKFELDPTDVRMKPERNQSNVRDYADERNFITREERDELDRQIAESKARGDDVVWSNDRNFGKTGWNGKFELDPTDIRIKPERNFSDVRDYAEAKNFRERTQ